MKLTRLQRHTAYCLMLAEYDNHCRNYGIYNRGLCWLIWEMFGLQNNGFSQYKLHEGINCVIENYFPELADKKKRIGFPVFWRFGDNKEAKQIRKNALKQCIEETY